jgi:S-adenosylmethionine hydrolase
LLQHKEVTCEQLKIVDVADAPYAVWWVDNFGNCKTTLLREDIPQDSEGNHLQTKFGMIGYFENLRDVPDDTTALITGSSGLGRNRFLEIVTQGESAEKKRKISSGDLVF